jgi:hypothetical protein
MSVARLLADTQKLLKRAKSLAPSVKGRASDHFEDAITDLIRVTQGIELTLEKETQPVKAGLRKPGGFAPGRRGRRR